MLAVLAQARTASECAWGVVPEDIRASEHEARCRDWSGEGDCPEISELISNGIREAERLVEISAQQTIPFVTEILRYISELLEIVSQHGLNLPSWVMMIFRLVPVVIPLLM